MKKKNKILALLGIVVVLCSMLLVALPITAVAAEQDNFVLGIYGNANEDDTIDMRDLTYVKLIFFGKKPETELADAKYDGKINPLDFIQIKLIIVGKEKELTVINSADRIVTVKMPVERIIPMTAWAYEPIWVLAPDKVVGVRTDLKESGGYSWLPGMQDKPTIGAWKEPDYEKIMELEPDIVITGTKKAEAEAEKLGLAGITVVGLDFAKHENFANGLKILAKILGKDERAGEFISWRQNCIDVVKERTEELEPEEKITVYGESNARLWLTPSKGTGFHGVITTAGGNNIAGDLPGGYVDVEPEWVVRENPEVIVMAATMYGWIPALGLDYFADESDIADMKQYLEETYNRTGLKETDAAKEGRVYLLHGALAEPACRAFVGVHYCAKWFYPEQFEDLEPEEIHREYFEEWLGVEYKGVWAYPPVS